MAEQEQNQVLDAEVERLERTLEKRRKRRRWRVWIFLVAHVAGAITSVNAILSTRTEQGAIAWAVSLNTLPYVAVPAYWILGRSRFNGYTLARRGKLEEVAGVSEEARSSVEAWQAELDNPIGRGVASERLAGIPFLRGNAVRLLVDGEATFDSILRGIDEAEEYVLFQFYIVRDDEIGREIKEHLIARARAGVKVYFLYDEIGSYDLPDSYIADLRAGGVEARDFHSQKGPGNRFQLNFRNHRKIVVVDGKVAWIGGHNVGDEYLGRDPEFGAWRDTHVRIEGPAALSAQLTFVEDWYWAANERPEVAWTPHGAEEGDVPVLVIPSGPADRVETANLMFVNAINHASSRIWIATPYFVPDRPVIAALQLAALRGVDVRILIPERADSLPVHLAAYSYLDEVGQLGVRFYRYEAGFLHQKVMLIDDDVATIGTANMDNRSFRLNFEVTAVIADEDFAAQLADAFERDFARSRLMENDEFARKPWYFRFGVRLSRLMSPLL